MTPRHLAEKVKFFQCDSKCTLKNKNPDKNDHLIYQFAITNPTANSNPSGQWSGTHGQDPQFWVSVALPAQSTAVDEVAGIQTLLRV
jgi:hypothetical protein